MKLSRYLVFNSLVTCLALIAQGASAAEAEDSSANDLVRAVPSLTITKTLALSGAELLLEPDQLRAAKAELEKSRGASFRYEPLLGDRKPPLDYTYAPVKTKAAGQ